VVVHVLEVGLVDVLVSVVLTTVRVVVDDVRVLVIGVGVIVDLGPMGVLVAVRCVVLVLRAHAVASSASGWSSVGEEGPSPAWSVLRAVT
jgi:hypothetical protein